jgi:hypothetical protein
MTQTNTEIAGSAPFFSSLLGRDHQRPESRASILHDYRRHAQRSEPTTKPAATVPSIRASDRPIGRESIAPLSAKSWPLDLRGLAQRCRSQRISLLGSRDSDALCNSPQDAFHLSSSSLNRSGLFERFGSERTIGSGPESEHHWKVGDTRQLWPHPSRTRFVDLFEPSQAIVHQETLLLRSRLFRHPCGSRRP